MSKGSVSAPDWTARASCRLLIGRLGCRPVSGGVSAALSAGTCPDMPGHAQACLNTPDLALTFHPGLFDIGQGVPILSGYFLLNGGDEG